MYVDGVLVAQDRGANCENRAVGPYPKFGLYCFAMGADWSDTQANSAQVIYYDFQIGEMPDDYFTAQ